ncbi:MAG TPA: thiamine pyrophosphate-dependent enzyme [Pirellulales bacterium]|jgi:thiamine pyrophosphate-dependent acetolactate synthase large subunit-like protein|nr:thiamine pyrophosphate-dependent enzyme [Pirellulales bacterium]
MNETAPYASHESSRMPLVPALEVIRQLRTDQIVVTTMGTAREWPRISSHPLDFHYIPSAMGQSPSIALGLALAQPEREVIVFSGDGSLLMNLGCLVTLAASRAKNLTLIALDNGVFEVTGGQKTAGQVARVDFAGLATAAGIESVATFDDLIDWQNGAAAVFKLPGPRFISLLVEPVRGDYFLEVPGPIRPRIERLRTALGV